MKTFSSARWIGVAAGTALLLSNWSTQAQPNREPNRERRGFERRAPERPPTPEGPERVQNVPPGQGSGAGLAGLFMVLTPEQRHSLRESMQQNRENNEKTERKLREAREALLEATTGKKFNEHEVRKQAKVISELEADRIVGMAKALSEVEPPLSASQREQLRNPAPPRYGFGFRRGAPGRDRFEDARRPQRPGSFDQPPRDRPERERQQTEPRYRF